MAHTLNDLAEEIDWNERYLDPLNLAYRSVETRKSPGDFLQILYFLRELDFNVDNCIDYANRWEPSERLYKYLLD